MYKIKVHPILDIIPEDETIFEFAGKKIKGEKGRTIAAALHQAGYPVHSHSLKDRPRSLECGIGKCGACEMLVDGEIKRICITKVDNVKVVNEIPKNYRAESTFYKYEDGVKVYITTVAIVGTGPAGLAAREILNQHGVDNIVIDNNDKIGGQFTMQTHQFFFFEKEKKFGGMRGFDIASNLAGEDHSGIFLNSTVWDILEGRKLAVKNIETNEIYYIEAEYLVIATGAVPFIPVFQNDDLPGVFSAAVVQKMMNNEFTLLGKNVLTIGAGNIGYLTSYQLMQAGANVKAIVEAMSSEGGFPVQANRVRRLGIPILLSHILLKAIPNANYTGITGAVIAECKDFKPVPGTEKIIDGIDAINICTGLTPDDLLLRKAKEIFHRNCYGIGDAVRIGEGTSAVLRGKQVAFEIMQELDVRHNYNDYLTISKEYIDSQQHPIRILKTPAIPSLARQEKPFVIADCLYGFACNPCAFSCPHDAITKTSSSHVPVIDYEKCIGCMKCVTQCPGLAIFGYNMQKKWIFLPIEFDIEEKTDVYLVDNQGKILGEGLVDKITKQKNKTHLAKISVTQFTNENLTEVRGFIVKENLPEALNFKPNTETLEEDEYVCHCDDVKMSEIMETIGDRKFISVDEVKHITRLGMGACRGKRCIRRLKTTLRGSGISIVGEPTPRGPMANPLALGELYPHKQREEYITIQHKKTKAPIKAGVLIAGGGIAGTSLFRYFSEAGLKPIMINHDRGSSWRNIAGGRPAFSLPEIADIARHNYDIFKEVDKIHNINLRQIRYVTFAHNDVMHKSLVESMAWQDAYMVDPKDFRKEISEYLNPNLAQYQSALITKDCWQATPGLVIDTVRKIGINAGGKVEEDCKLIDVTRNGKGFKIIVKNHEGEFTEYHTDIFVNALGGEANKFAQRLGIETGLYPVKHQAFITRRLPNFGIHGEPLDMIIDRRNYKGFSAVYGQQLAETGQIIGCASPAVEEKEVDKNLKINSKEFMEICSEIFVDWIPELSSVGIQAVWAGYYIEPRMICDPENGLLIGLRGQGFMLGQYLAKLYVDKVLGRQVPEYFSRLALKGDGLLEKAFK
jgi:glycine/D-amino acid oxidase-like deaminating enzyme/NADPH-dependent 2,4-dienoyl-CoA reductase/sulfur reductase-like enzyme/Fe-S-cluster-containing hydrogenase component 2